MQQNSEAIEILRKHVDSTVSLINSLKQTNSQLITEKRSQLEEIKRLKAEIKEHSAYVKKYEEKMSSLEALLDEAQREQSKLEQSILTAISSLGTINNNETSFSAISSSHEEAEDLGGGTGNVLDLLEEESMEESDQLDSEEDDEDFASFADESTSDDKNSDSFTLTQRSSQEDRSSQKESTDFGIF